MALEGTIKEFGLADIFQLIGLQKKTGILFLKGEDESVYIHFEDGMVVKAEESRKRPKYLTGHILVNRGKVTEDKLNEALDAQKSTGQKIGGMLIGMGIITKDDLREVLSFQMSETIYKVFRWKGGDYKFDQERVDYDRDTIVPISSEHILMDGVRMLDEWPIIDKKLPSYDIVLAKKEGAPNADEESEEGDIFSAEGEKDKKRGVLGKDAKSVLALIDGRKSIYEILDYSRLGEFDTCKTLLDLLEKSLVVKTGARPEIMSEPVFHQPAAPAAKSLPAYADKLPFIFAVLAIILIIVQVTGTRKIMSANASGIESLKTPFDVNEVELIWHNSVLHYMDYGTYPESVKVLEQLDYIHSDDVKDPWGTQINIALNDKGGVSISSAGPDRKFGTTDDISTRP